MRRRSFIKALLALATAPLLPSLPEGTLGGMPLGPPNYIRWGVAEMHDGAGVCMITDVDVDTGWATRCTYLPVRKA